MHTTITCLCHAQSRCLLVDHSLGWSAIFEHTTVSCMKLVIFLLYINRFIYQYFVHSYIVDVVLLFLSCKYSHPALPNITRYFITITAYLCIVSQNKDSQNFAVLFVVIISFFETYSNYLFAVVKDHHWKELRTFARYIVLKKNLVLCLGSISAWVY